MEICEMKRYLIGVVTFVLVLVNALQVILIVTPLVATVCRYQSCKDKF